MALVHRPWIVRVLTYILTGAIVGALLALAVATVVFLFWGVLAGPLWLQWSIGVPLALILLAFSGRSYHRGGF